MIEIEFLEERDARRARQLLVYAAIAMAIFGIVIAPDLTATFSWLSVLVAGLLPSIIWLSVGAPGIPILPIVAIAYIVYFGVPALSGDITLGQPDQQFAACITTALFLGMATIGWYWVIVRRMKRVVMRGTKGPQFDFGMLMLPFIQASLLIGLSFQVGSIEGLLWWTGPFFGIFRAIAMSATSAASFLIGNAIGTRTIPKDKMLSIYITFAAVMILQLTDFLLVFAMVYMAALVFGYIIAAKRIPWAALVILIAITGVLHIGKAEMRKRYWGVDAQGTVNNSVFKAPGLILEWVGVSIDQLLAPRQLGAAEQQSLLGRASLLKQLIVVEQSTPQLVPYMGGLTYSLFPALFIPRFLTPDKLNSQISAHLLSVRYGYMTPEQTASTTIGWGIIPEAFANFGYAGVVIAAITFGLLVGWLSALSIGTAPLSLANLIAISGLLNLINVEADFGFLMLNIWQSMIAVCAFFYGLRFFMKRAGSTRSETT